MQKDFELIEEIVQILQKGMSGYCIANIQESMRIGADVTGETMPSGRVFLKFNIGNKLRYQYPDRNGSLGIKIFEGAIDLASFRNLHPSTSYYAIVLKGLA